MIVVSIPCVLGCPGPCRGHLEVGDESDPVPMEWELEHIIAEEKTIFRTEESDGEV